jgi:hypothetical protein
LPSRRSSPAGLPVRAEDVVAQLERDSQREPEPTQCLDLVVVPSAERPPDRERRLDAVLRALVDDDALGPGEVLLLVVAGPRALLEDVEVLAEGDLGAHQVELGARAGRAGAVLERPLGVGEDLVRPHEEQVAEQDRGGAAELVAGARPAAGRVHPGEAPVRRGRASTGVGVVDDVVVDEGRRVEQLEPGADARDGVGAARMSLAGDRRDGRPAGLAEACAEPLAPAEKVPRKVAEGGDVLSYGAQNWRAPGEEFIDSELDAIDQTSAVVHPTSLCTGASWRLCRARSTLKRHPPGRPHRVANLASLPRGPAPHP